MPTQSRSEDILELARELLDDMELGRTDAERLVMKASRLARWVGSEEVRYWLKLELGGYNDTDPISLKYMSVTGRWLDRKRRTGFWGLLAQQEASIAAERAKLAALRVPDLDTDYAIVSVRHITDAMNASSNYIIRMSA